MDRIFSLLITVILITLAFTDIVSIQAQSLDPPQNSVVLQNRQGRVNCSAQPGNDVIVWSHSLWEVEGQVEIWRSDDQININPEKYTVDVDESRGRYDLVLLMGEPADGGTYHVKLEQAKIEYDVEVVVLSGLNCNPGENGFETLEGAEIVVTASTAVYGNIEPIMRWYNDGELVLTYEYLSEDNITKSVMANQSATPEANGTKYRGELLFDTELGGNRPPTHTDSCNTFYTVLYQVQEIQIEPHTGAGEDLIVLPDSQLNCSARGNPPPGYYWFCSNGDIVEGRLYTVKEESPEEMSCICRASNRVLGQPYEIQTNVTFLTTSSAEHRNPCIGLLVALLLMIAFSVR